MLFTYDSYKELLDIIIGREYSIIGIEDYIIARQKNKVPDSPLAVIRHDVDYYPERAIEMAAIEAQRNIAVTYYIRRRFFDDNIEAIRKIAKYGHQIGYHYEEMDTHQKAPNQQIARDAVGFFVGSLLDLDNLGFPIRTICAHGNPMTDVDNRQVVHLLRSGDFLDQLAFTFDRDLVMDKVSNRLIGDASIDITGEDFDIYIPDTGRFNPKCNLKDHIDNCPTVGLSGLDDLRDLFEPEKNKRIYMNMHPDRWSGSWPVWLCDFMLDSGKNTIKRLMGKKILKEHPVGQKVKGGNQKSDKGRRNQ